MSHHIFEISRGSGSCSMQKFWVAALVFCCLAVCLQIRLFVIDHNRAPQRRQKHCTCFILIENGTQLVGSSCACGWLMVSCILIPSFSRETTCQKVINCQQAQTSCCLETLMQAENNVTRQHVYGSVLWNIFVCEEQIKHRISLCIQFPNCVLYLEMGYIES